MRPKGQIFDLKTFRTKYNVTQKELSKALNVTSSFLSSIERGKRSAPKSMLDQLAQMYNVTNIREYLSDQPSTNVEIKNIKSSMINSPGGVYLPRDIAEKLSKEDLVKILTRDETPISSSTHSNDNSQTLLQLLLAAEERYNRERARADRLESELTEMKIKFSENN